MEEQRGPEWFREEAKRRREFDEKKYQEWWSGLTDERKVIYQELPVIGGDGGEEQIFHLRKCRFLLEIISGLKSSDGRKINPVGLAIHGSLPVVFIQAEGQETPRGISFNQLTHRPATEGKFEEKFYSDVDTAEFGLPTTDAGQFKFKLDTEQVNERLKKMR